MVDLLKAAEALRRQRLGQQKPKSLLAAAEQTRALMGSNLPQPAPQQPQQAPQNQGSVLGDIGHGLAAGTANLAGAIGDIPNLLTAGAVPPLSPSLSAFSEQQRAQYRPETQQAMQNIQQAEGFGGTLSAIAQNPVGAAQYVVESAPSFVPGVAAVTGASRLAKGAALAKGLTQQAAQQAAVRAGTRAAVGTNATLSGAFAGQQAAQGVREMPQDQLEALPDYQALLAEGIAPDAAREALANRAGRYAGAVGAPLGAATGMIGAPIEARLASGQAATLGGALSRIGATAGSQTLEEGLQEGSEQFAANVGQRQVNPAQALTEGVPESIALGGTLGAVAGGGLSAAGEVARLRQPQDTPQPEQAPPAPQPEQPTLSLPSPGRQRMDRVGQVIMPDGSTTNSPADVEDFVADFVQNVAPDAQEATAMDLRNAIYGGFFEKNGLDKFIERGQKTRRATYLNQPERPPIAGKGAVFEQGQRERTTQPQQVRRPADIEGEFYQDANVGGRGFEQQTTPPKRQQQRKLTTEKRNALAEQVLAG
ncbi:MAG: hypothetical protein KDK05_21780, partial [Candidatus Competibacteraceae bacterium]|nr:hypothetical protein [Candidatus Competibacteraceae bacterium]